MAGLKGQCAPGDVYVHCALAPGEPTPGWEGGLLQPLETDAQQVGGKNGTDRQDWGLSPAPIGALDCSAHLLDGRERT